MSTVQGERDPNHNGLDIIVEAINKKTIKYMECLKNHAAAIGGNTKDGCGEFLAAGQDGTIEALQCAACSCHRNFHRKILLPSPPASSEDEEQVAATPSPQLIKDGPCLSPSKEVSCANGSGKKRFRTKFTQEQKEKMLEFAEKSGWKIQKLGESEVKSFCQELGVKRKVLKVWMHNNKYQHLAANNTAITIAHPPPEADTQEGME